MQKNKVITVQNLPITISKEDIDDSNDDINRYLYDAEPMKELSEAQELIDFYAVPEPKSQHCWILVRKLDGAKLGFEFYGRTENYHFHGKDYLHYVFTRKRDATISCGNV